MSSVSRSAQPEEAGLGRKRRAEPRASTNKKTRADFSVRSNSSPKSSELSTLSLVSNRASALRFSLYLGLGDEEESRRRDDERRNEVG